MSPITTVLVLVIWSLDGSAYREMVMGTYSDPMSCTATREAILAHNQTGNREEWFCEDSRYYLAQSHARGL